MTEQDGNIKAQPFGSMWDNFDGQYLLQNFLEGWLKFDWPESQLSLSICLILPLPPFHHTTHSLTNILQSKLHLSEYFWKTQHIIRIKWVAYFLQGAFNVKSKLPF